MIKLLFADGYTSIIKLFSILRFIFNLRALELRHLMLKRYELTRH